MRIANAAGRLVLLDGSDSGQERAVDVAYASEGRFAADPQAVYDRWAEFRAWAATETFDEATSLDIATLDTVVPAPRQVFAIGLNYRAHAEESGFALPESRLCHASTRQMAGRLAAPTVTPVAPSLCRSIVWTDTFNKFDPTSPFDGYGESGFGRQGGRIGLGAYLAD